MKPNFDSVELERCQFNKHKDKLWIEVVEEDPDYVEWLISGEGPEMGIALYDYLTELLEDR